MQPIGRIVVTRRFFAVQRPWHKLKKSDKFGLIGYDILPIERMRPIRPQNNEDEHKTKKKIDIATKRYRLKDDGPVIDMPIKVRRKQGANTSTLVSELPNK
ncbi:hypothetical protein M3Y96_00675300 [Aphelenchoides besseyi]|nr:hypothetical protein M3Y96_00675300 [Aphelenchoides besseyi]